MDATAQRCSILVGAAGPQEGPKNPSSGISVKSVVPALNASLGWVLEGGSLIGTLRFQGALQWHGEAVPVIVETCSRAGCLLPSWCGVGTAQGGTCNAVQTEALAFYDAVCRVACLAWCGADRGSCPLRPRPGQEGNCPLKYPLQKRLKNR